MVYLPLDSFGRYVIVWSISLLIENAQVSLILDSMPAIVSRHGQQSRQRLDVAGTLGGDVVWWRSAVC